MLSAEDSAFAWDEELSPKERAALIERAARGIVARGLQTPAILALEMHKPLAFVASQTMIVATPLLGPLIGIDRMQQWGRLLAAPGAVEELLARIEAYTAERDAGRTTPATKAA